MKTEIAEFFQTHPKSGEVIKDGVIGAGALAFGIYEFTQGGTGGALIGGYLGGMNLERSIGTLFRSINETADKKKSQPKT